LLITTKEDSLAILNECIKQKVDILGVDGFYRINNTTIPSLENSLDVSNVADLNLRYSQVMNLLENADENCLFEIVLAD
jgi:hypothetical protein